MGRTNYAILGIGLAACLLLSLMMQHTLKVKRPTDVPHVVAEIMQLHGSRFSDAAEFATREVEGGRYGELVIYPLLSASRRQLAQQIGEYAWRNLGPKWPIDALVVTCDDGLGRRQRFAVPRPQEIGKGLTELGPNEVPSFAPALATSRPTETAPNAGTPIPGGLDAASLPSSRPLDAAGTTTQPVPTSRPTRAPKAATPTK